MKENNKIIMGLILQFAILTDPGKFELNATFHNGELVDIYFFHYESEKDILFQYLTETNRLKIVLPYFKKMAKHLPHDKEKMQKLVDSLFACGEVIIEKNKIIISDI